MDYLQRLREFYLNKFTPEKSWHLEESDYCVYANKYLLKNSIVIENVIAVTFNSMYPKLLLMFYDNDILIHHHIDESVIKRLRQFFDSKKFGTRTGINFDNLSTYHVDKNWVNTLWINELSDIRSDMFMLFKVYCNYFFQNLKSISDNRLLYIDTDMFVLLDIDRTQIDSIITNFCGNYLTYDISYHRYFYLEKLKHLIFAENSNDVTKHGIIHKADEVLNIIKQRERDIQLEKLGL